MNVSEIVPADGDVVAAEPAPALPAKRVAPTARCANCLAARMGGRVVDGTGLENRKTPSRHILASPN